MFFSLCGTSVNAIEYASSASNEIATTNSQITKNAAVDVTTSSEAVQNSLAEVTTGAAVTVDMQAPTVPTKLVASSITSTSCILSWTASTDNVGVTEYDIYSGTTKIGSTTGETTFEVTGLMPNTSYSFTIAAKDLAGNASEASGALSVTTIMNTEVTTGSAVTVDMQAPTVPTNLVSSSITSTSCILSWTASTDNIGVTEYDIYNGTTKIGSTTGETTYDVTGLMPNTSYSFTIVAKDLAGNTSEVSSILTIKTLSSSIIISSDLKLTKDIEYQDVEITSGEVDLNGHTMTINGNLIQSNGEVNIDGGQLIVNGDYRLQTKSNSNGTVSYDYGSGYLTMNKASDYVLVNGNFIDQSRYSGTLTAGTLEVKGDFYEKVYYTYWGDYDGNFSASGSHKVILSGTGTQTVSFDNRGKSHFNILEISSSANSIKFATAIPLNKFEGDSKKVSNLNLYFCAPLSSDLTIENDLILSNGLDLNGHVLTVNNLVVSGGTMQLNENNVNINGYFIINGGTVNLIGDSHINGDLNINGGEVDLNGHTMTINGNLIQSNGEVNIDGGQLIVNGDYRLQTKSNSNGTVSYDYGSGYLTMNKASDYVLVNGNFIDQSRYSGTLTAGTLEVKGDFYEKVYYTYWGDYDGNFSASGSHKVILSGTGTQTVSFDNRGKSHFNILEISSSANSIKFATAIPLNKFEGDSKKVSNLNLYFCAPLSSDLTIENDLILSNGLNFNGGNLNISRNLVISGGTIDLHGGNLNINGDLIISGGTFNLDGGRTNVNGNITQPGGELYVNGGQLTVNGDYRIQVKDDLNGTVCSEGSLKMDNAADYILVKKNFVIQSYNSSSSLTAGTLEVKGDFYQKKGFRYYFYGSSYCYNNFVASGSHKVILYGTASFENPDYSHFNILVNGKTSSTSDSEIDFYFDLNTGTITGYRGSGTEVIIPNTIGGVKVTRIGREAFEGCDHIISITIPDSVTSIGYDAFYNCSSLKNLTIPSSVKSIEYGAFGGCSRLTSLSFSDGLASIGDKAFYNCISLMDISIPNSVTSMEGSPFYYCRATYYVENKALRDLLISHGVSPYKIILHGQVVLDDIDTNDSNSANQAQPPLTYVICVGYGGSIGCGVGATGAAGVAKDSDGTVVGLISAGGGGTTPAAGAGWQIQLTNAKSVESLKGWGTSAGGSATFFGVGGGIDYETSTNPDGTPWSGVVISVGANNVIAPFELHANESYTWEITAQDVDKVNNEINSKIEWLNNNLSNEEKKQINNIIGGALLTLS